MSLISDVQHHLESFWDGNSNTILTAGALVGFGAALYFTARGSVKADRKVKELKKQKDEDIEQMTTVDILKVAVPEYLPTIVASAITVTCILSNHHINEEQKIALCSAYAMLGKSYEKYRNKTKEIAGEETAKKIDAAMADDVWIKQHGGVFPYKDDLQDIEHCAADEAIFYDPLSELYFHTTPEIVRRAEYHLNRDIALRGNVSMLDFYRYLGIDKYIAGSRRARRKFDKLGWDFYCLLTEYEQAWVDFDHEFIETNSDVDDAPSGFYIVQPVIQPRLLDEDYEFKGRS